MRALLRLVLMVAVWFGLADWAYGQDDIFDFFAEEAKVVQTVTASRLPLSVRQSPATVHVVTGEDIRTMGAQTLWDALRGVPGVDVMSTRAFYGEVSLRGLNRATNNRTLVLMDGRSVIGGPFDSVHWEALPITPDLVDRIEVVLGPASALYGANAETGVINIITREPTDGGRAQFSYGEQKTHLGSFSHGTKQGNLGFLTQIGWRSANGFEDSDADASDVMHIHTRLDYDNFDGHRLQVSGGLSDYESAFSFGPGGVSTTSGRSGFVSLDGAFGSFAIRAFWNRGRQRVRDFLFLGNTSLDTDVWEATVSHSTSPGKHNRLIWGATFRRKVTMADVYSVPKLAQHSWGFFAENAWQAAETFTVVTSARLDYHPQTDWQFSPRVSLVFSPNAQHVFRLSGSTSFRNPAPTENHMRFDVNLQDFIGLPATISVRGNTDLKPEKLSQIELAHVFRLGSLTTTATGFHYRVWDMISVGETTLDQSALPRLLWTSTYRNLPTTARVWGGELSAEWKPRSNVTAYANYAYVKTSGELDIQMAANGGPKHKLNLGLNAEIKGLTAGVWAHHVGETFWQNGDIQGSGTLQYDKVDAYWVVNGQLRYAFKNDLKGMSLSLGGFNLLNKQHYEILPTGSALKFGQNGEEIGRRITMSLSYRF